jgi:hypothetical protein
LQKITPSRLVIAFIIGFVLTLIFLEDVFFFMSKDVHKKVHDLIQSRPAIKEEGLRKTEEDIERKRRERYLEYLNLYGAGHEV